jgi:hypothetical protein
MTRARSRILSRSVWTAFAALLLATAAQAQPGLQPTFANPRLFSLTPSGGKIGSTVEVTWTGFDAENAEKLVFSHPGIKAEAVQPPPPPPPDPKQPPPPAAAKPQVTKFKVTIGADVPVGIYDVRLVNTWGVSNPRAFVVGDLNEVLEKEPNNDVPEAQRVEMNTTINGNMAAPTDVDYYVFAGKKGQRVLAVCLATSIDSRLDPVVEIYNANGKMLAQNRAYSHSDALADCTLPDDGDYYVRLYQFTHTAGNAEFFYRLSITTAPWIDVVYPPMIEPGKSAQVTVYGRNLPDGKPDPAAVVGGVTLEKITATVSAPGDPAAVNSLRYSGRLAASAHGLTGFEYRVRNAAGFSNPFQMSYAAAPVVLDAGNNDSADTPQAIKVPCEIAGQIEKKRDRDWYAFDAKKGDVFRIECYSDRIGAPNDMYMVLRNMANKQDQEVDDNPEVIQNMKFYAESRDPPPIRLAVPADGKYQLLVGSRTGDTQAGVRHYYRVRITPEQPDFHLVALGPSSYRPDTCCVPQGGSQNYSIFAYREDGFTGDITLTVEGLPTGVTCPPQTISAGLKRALLVLTAADSAPIWTGEVKIKGTATINGKPVVREAQSGTLVWYVQPGQGIPTPCRLDRGVQLAVRDKAPWNLTATIDKAEYVPGDKAPVISVKLARLWPDFKQPLQIPPQQQQGQQQQPPLLPQGFQIPNLTLNPGKDDGQITLNIPNNIPPGTYNIVLTAGAQLPYNKDPMAKQKPNTIITFPSTPVALTILPKTVATVAVTNPTPNVKVGTQTDVVVKVTRQFDYQGEFKLQLVLPPNMQGLSSQEVTIPAGQDEAKVSIKIDAAATPGARNDLLVRTTATYKGKPLVQDSPKFNLNVTK